MGYNINDITGTGQDDIVTLDEICGKFKQKTQRQEYYEPQPQPETEDLNPKLVDPDGEAADEAAAPVWTPDNPQHEISPERYQRTGLRIAKAIDTGFNFVASNFIANGSEKEYKADKDDLNDLGEAWGELAQKKQWEMSPVWQVLILSAMVYIPLAKEAFNDRRIMEIERRQDEQADELERTKEEIKALQNELHRRHEAERKSSAEE